MTRDSRSAPAGEDPVEGLRAKPASDGGEANRPNTVPSLPPSLQDERVERVAHIIFCEVGACNGDPYCFRGVPEHVRDRWIEAVRKGLAIAAQADAASLPLVDERLRELREKAHKGPWARWEKDGSGWDDYAHELHGRVQSETHDIADFFHDEDRDFVVALVDWFDTLTATKPSGQVERVAIIEECAKVADDYAAHLTRLDAPLSPVGRNFCTEVAKRIRALAALSTQVQTVGGE